MQIMHYLIKYGLICISFRNTNLKNLIKPSSKLIFVDILKLKVLTQGILDVLFYYYINQKTLSTDRIFTMFIGIKCYINNMNDI